MKLPLILRRNKAEIRTATMTIFEKPLHTYFVSPHVPTISRQRAALAKVGHLGIAPSICKEFRLRGFNVLMANHMRLQPYQPRLLEGSRAEKIQLIRRLGAAIGMGHSIREERIGLLGSNTKPSVAAMLHHLNNMSMNGGRKREVSEIISSLWTESGGALVLNFRQWPQVNLADGALFFMDFSRAMIFDPLWDLARLNPGSIGLEELFFWEYFLQGYCATGELPANWKERLEVLTGILSLHSKTARPADLRRKWWKQLI
ncbi:MAG: hypothetical protein FH749_06125 [Firmicutes bacterium]|nr:hypothetical protein [Bacillota bacterium]